ncbi:MAG: hypothetical protein KKA65_04745 [Nanoarchaeota archaeon]|nr:hypothetical protein [Nanoarchaeota archaeon]MBU4242091.1 hypothetical protein [Nanoarchaeota archaeon]MBU4351512.1 hypothetical protein [Nanoarchaeota archaeon]MBU4456784.1 hypothetical protein [Nanoarchaeota archaeon]MCG2719123.1 hypothetical protein [Nanoarchaeota archaeon]
MNEDFIELKCYIKYNFYYGHSALEIKNALLNAGWDIKIIGQAFNEAQKDNLIPKPTATRH